MFETKGFWSISVDVSCLLLGESSHTHTHTHTLAAVRLFNSPYLIIFVIWSDLFNALFQIPIDLLNVTMFHSDADPHNEH